MAEELLFDCIDQGPDRSLGPGLEVQRAIVEPNLPDLFLHNPEAVTFDQLLNPGDLQLTMTNGDYLVNAFWSQYIFASLFPDSLTIQVRVRAWLYNVIHWNAVFLQLECNFPLGDYINHDSFAEEFIVSSLYDFRKADITRIRLFLTQGIGEVHNRYFQTLHHYCLLSRGVDISCQGN